MPVLYLLALTFLAHYRMKDFQLASGLSTKEVLTWLWELNCQERSLVFCTDRQISGMCMSTMLKWMIIYKCIVISQTWQTVISPSFTYSSQVKWGLSSLRKGIRFGLREISRTAWESCRFGAKISISNPMASIHTDIIYLLLWPAKTRYWGGENVSSQKARNPLNPEAVPLMAVFPFPFSP